VDRSILIAAALSGLCLSIAGQQAESKVSNPNAQAAFDSALKQIMAAAGKDFQSLRGKFDGVAGLWAGTVDLPGMKCTIEQVPSGDSGGFHFSATSRYRCVAQKETSDAALLLYSDLINMVIASIGAEPVVEYNLPKMKAVNLPYRPFRKDSPAISVEFRDPVTNTQPDAPYSLFDCNAAYGHHARGAAPRGWRC
jgi:hypothetical protein